MQLLGRHQLDLHPRPLTTPLRFLGATLVAPTTRAPPRTPRLSAQISLVMVTNANVHHLSILAQIVRKVGATFTAQITLVSARITRLSAPISLGMATPANALLSSTPASTAKKAGG